MDNNNFIDFSEFARIISDKKSDDKYCFFIGSGASVSSGIPIGREMVKEWFDELKCGKSEDTFKQDIEKRIEKIQSFHQEYTPEENSDLVDALRKYESMDYIPNISQDQDDYNYIYELRYAYNEEEGKEYFLEKSDNAYPNAGYIALSSILCNCKKANVVITTNFDELIENASFIYQQKRILSIEHEELAYCATETWGNRPKILKLHRGVALGGLNKKDETEVLNEKWKDAIDMILKDRIPIVVGYSGTDKDIMDYLEKTSLNGIYWCHRYASIPNERVKNIVNKNNGRMVSIFSADQLFCDMETLLVKRKEQDKHSLKYIMNSSVHIYDPTRATVKINHLSKETKKLINASTKVYKGKSIEQLKKMINDVSTKISMLNSILFLLAFILSATSLMKCILYTEEKRGNMYARGFLELGKIYQNRKNWEMCLEEYNKVIENPNSEKYFKAQAMKNKSDVLKLMPGKSEEAKKIIEEVYKKMEPYNKHLEGVLQKND